MLLASCKEAGSAGDAAPKSDGAAVAANDAALNRDGVAAAAEDTAPNSNGAGEELGARPKLSGLACADELAAPKSAKGKVIWGALLASCNTGRHVNPPSLQAQRQAVLVWQY